MTKLDLNARRLGCLRRANEIYRRRDDLQTAWVFEDLYGVRSVATDVERLRQAGLVEPGPDEIRNGIWVTPLRRTKAGDQALTKTPRIRTRRSAARGRVTPIPHDPDAVRQAREMKGWNQAELARRLRISRSHMCEIEAGTRGVPPALLIDMARVLDATTDALKAPRRMAAA